MCVSVEAVDVNWQSFDGKTALLLAAAEGHSTCMQLLLHHGADVNLSDYMQDAPLLAGRLMLPSRYAPIRQWPIIGRLPINT